MRIKIMLGAIGLWMALSAPLMAQQDMPAGKPAKPVESTIAPLGEGVARQACTQMWCQEGYFLHMKAEQWPEGYYSFKVVTDDKVYNCEGNLPLQACGMPSVICNDKAITIGESGCAMAPETHSFYGVTLKDIPKHISVTVSGPTGTVIHEGQVNKQCSYPNGKQCDPRECCAAIDYMSINW